MGFRQQLDGSLAAAILVLYLFAGLEMQPPMVDARSQFVWTDEFETGDRRRTVPPRNQR